MVDLANEGKNENPIKIGANFPKDMKPKLIVLLKEFREIFAWSYQDMPGLDTEIVVHRIPVKPEKQLKADFFTTIAYSDWVANIVPIPKKDRKVCICVDYRD